jgi:two-component system OmpR family response regulator
LENVRQSPIRVLYVEDEDDIRMVAEIALGGDVFELHACATGQEAVSKAADLNPDVLLLDVMMPGMDGPSTLDQLRKLSGLADTPAIFMTAKVQPSEIQQLKSLGALDVIAKPFDPMGLADQLRTILEAA